MELTKPVPQAPPRAVRLLGPVEPDRLPVGPLGAKEPGAPRATLPALPSPSPNAAWLPTDDAVEDPLR